MTEQHTLGADDEEAAHAMPRRLEPRRAATAGTTVIAVS
eukprot:COSAG06_NODE_53028_length_302_cov_1.009852_1_plen_38_part_01